MVSGAEHIGGCLSDGEHIIYDARAIFPHIIFMMRRSEYGHTMMAKSAALRDDITPRLNAYSNTTAASPRARAYRHERKK